MIEDAQIYLQFTAVWEPDSGKSFTCIAKVPLLSTWFEPVLSRV